MTKRPWMTSASAAVVVLFLVLAIGLGVLFGQPARSTSTGTPTPSSPVRVLPTAAFAMSPAASAYLAEALDIMQEHALNRTHVDWDTLRPRAYDQVDGALAPSDTYGAIRFALAQLRDRHSFLMTPTQVSQWQDGTLDEANPDPEGRLLENRLGYVSLPGFAGEGETTVEYATAVQQIIRQADSEGPCGWIVDLRQNTGGNMWPMLAGIGPVLGEGRVGAFDDLDGQQTSWYYRDGQARLEDAVLAGISGSAYQLSSASPPVAVLTGPSTASSGEAIVVALRGRPDTRSFGEPTSGRSTSNRRFILSDGAWLLLTVSVFADRTGRTYGGKIPPDELVPEAQAGSDSVVQAAVEWLSSQPACDANGP